MGELGNEHHLRSSDRLSLVNCLTLMSWLCISQLEIGRAERKIENPS